MKYGKEDRKANDDYVLRGAMKLKNAEEVVKPRKSMNISEGAMPKNVYVK